MDGWQLLPNLIVEEKRVSGQLPEKRKQPSKAREQTRGILLARCRLALPQSDL